MAAEHDQEDPGTETVVQALAQWEEASPFPQRLKDKVCIVGFAESSRHETPFADDSFEFWGLNRLHTVLEHDGWDRWFQIHDIAAHHNGDEEHLGWLRSKDFPVYLRPEDVGTVDLPNAEPYPYQAVLDRFAGAAGGSYLTNSISWLIALAIAMEFKEIHVYGVDMAQDAVLQSEYGTQRPSCEYWLGLAEGLGIKIYIPPGADLLLATHLYGFSNGDRVNQKLMHRLQELGQRKENVKQQVAQVDQQIAQLQAQRQNGITQIQHLDGAMQNCQYFLRNLAAEWAAAPVRNNPTEAEVTAGG